MNITAKIILVVLTITLAIAFGRPSAHAMQGKSDQTEPAKGFEWVKTEKYSIQVPSGWTVQSETPWGARDITPKSGPGQMGAMTAGPTSDTWDSLYRTSLFFIKREGAGTETPYRTGKTKQGYDCISFEVQGKDGFANRRYTLIKNAQGNVLALSIKIPSPNEEKAFKDMFQHMVDTAKVN